MDKKFIMTATGDSLFTADIPEEYFKGDFKEIEQFMSDCGLKMTNLETNVSEFGDFPNAFSGGTWLNATPNDFDGLVKFGFNYYSTANNHCSDYSYHGLLSTIDELDKRSLAHSGTGKCLEDAEKPATITLNEGKVAIISVDSSFKEGSKAGYTTKKMKGRPGVNYLGFESYYPITTEQLGALKDIAKTSKVNAYEELLVSSGFSHEAGNGVYKFGGVKFCYDGSKKRTECNKADKKRIIDGVKKAKQTHDYVILAVHCHAIGESLHEQVPDFLTEIAREAIDNGVSAVIGHGTHELRPLEIYKGHPIFYSLGDFIYQGMRVKELPADFMIKYGVDVNATAKEGLDARSKGGKIGLQTERKNFLTVLPKIEFDGDKMVSLSMLPIVAGFNREGKMDGLPYVAKGEEAQEIISVLDRLSKPYGTELKLSDGIITLK